LPWTPACAGVTKFGNRVHSTPDPQRIGMA
jgi:hypothetical protein